MTFEVSGCLLLGTDNGNLSEFTSFASPTLPLWHGAASAVVLREENNLRIEVQVRIGEKLLKQKMILA